MHACAGFIYIRGEFVNERQAVLRAIDEAYKAGWVLCVSGLLETQTVCALLEHCALEWPATTKLCATPRALPQGPAVAAQLQQDGQGADLTLLTCA